MMIEVSDLTKSFAGLKVLKGISFSVQNGEIAGLIGPNGAGKTTIMRILAGYLPATRGTVLIDGLDVWDYSLEVRRRIGYLPENPALYSDMRVDEFLMFRAALKGVRRAERKGRVKEVKTLCRLEKEGRRLIGQLSQGYRQRVGLADALVHDPSLLILDEPTVGLDPHESRNIRDLILNLGYRYTVLLSTHFLSEAEMVCRRILILNQGRIVAADSPEALMESARGTARARAEILGPWHEVMGELAGLPGTFKVSYHSRAGQPAPANKASPIWGLYTIEFDKASDIRSAVFDMAGRHGWTLRELGMERQKLEDVFMEITGEGDAT